MRRGLSQSVGEAIREAPDGTVPMWGQTGNYIIDVDGTCPAIQHSKKLNERHEARISNSV